MDAFADLIRRGREKGFLTIDEIDAALPPDARTPEIDRAMEEIEANGIRVHYGPVPDSIPLPSPLPAFEFTLIDRNTPLPEAHREIEFVAPLGERMSFHLGRWREDVELLREPEAIVAGPSVRVIVKYPVRVGALVQLTATSPAGFTRIELLSRLGEIYELVYREEERTRSASPEVVTRGGNVSPTDGTFGIYGHTLDQLVLDQIFATTDASGELIWLNVGS